MVASLYFQMVHDIFRVLNTNVCVFFFFSIVVLKWSDILAEYALFMLMTYLTGVWKLNFRHAAAIVNVFWGMIAIMPIAMKFIKLKSQIPDRWVVLLCSFAYTVVSPYSMCI